MDYIKAEKYIEPWIKLLVIASFDTSIGPKIDVICPNSSLNNFDLNKIKMILMPHSDNKNESQIFFSFKMRLNSKIPLFSTNPDEEEFLYGFTLFEYVQFINFRRFPDSSSQRGFIQESFCIFSELLLFNLYYSILKLFAIEYRRSGQLAIDNLFIQAAQWYTP